MYHIYACKPQLWRANGDSGMGNSDDSRLLADPEYKDNSLPFLPGGPSLAGAEPISDGGGGGLLKPPDVRQVQERPMVR